MRTVLVAGAASGVGEGVVRTLVAGGLTVLATSRNAERLAQLRDRLEPPFRARCIPIVGEAGDFAGAGAIVERAQALGGADAAVAILGRGWWSSGPIIEVGPDEWSAILDEMLTGHFAFARAVMPMLAGRPDSLYLAIGGGAAFEPMRDAGLVSIAAAGQLMLTRILAREVAPPPQIRELVINGPVNTRESRLFAEPDWISEADVGTVVSELVHHGATTWTATREDGPLIVMNARHDHSEAPHDGTTAGPGSRETDDGVVDG